VLRERRNECKSTAEAFATDFTLKAKLGVFTLRRQTISVCEWRGSTSARKCENAVRDRVLRHLPPKVLAAETYRNLVGLLADPVTAKFLHHIGSIKESTITGLARLPAALRRPAIMALFGKIDGMDTFVDGLRHLAFRAALPFETLATQIGSLGQTDQVIAKIYQIVETVPLPATLPPVTIGDFNRIDCVTEIRGLPSVFLEHSSQMLSKQQLRPATQ